MAEIDVRHTIVAKSDQLNADDLIGSPLTIEVTDVHIADSPDQPLAVSYAGDNGKPYKPCKSMRRVLVNAWGHDGAAWIGKRMQLYRDDAVKFSGQAVGGIRISHLSDIKTTMNIMLQQTRGKRAGYRVDPLKSQKAAHEKQPADYPDDVFRQKLPVILETIKSGKMTTDQAVAQLEKTGKLSAAQVAQIEAGLQAPAPETEDDVF